MSMDTYDDGYDECEYDRLADDGCPNHDDYHYHPPQDVRVDVNVHTPPNSTPLMLFIFLVGLGLGGLIALTWLAPLIGQGVVR